METDKEMRINYWTNSKFANWLRGTKKPNALGLGEWDKWKQEAKQKHPIRYWLAEEGLDHIQDFVSFPKDVYNKISYYINNRWISKTHALTSNMKKGDYYDLDTRIIECLFDELVNFVEVELAWHRVAWSDKERAPWWRRVFRFRTWRSPEHGIDHLNWEISLKYNEDWDKDNERYGQPTPQAEAAKEKLALYNWWKQRANRPDPHDASGWSEYCRANPKFLDTLGSAESKMTLDRLNEIEKRYDEEDTEMLIRLIKVRKSLWT
jgi:hypothetical protein